MKIAVPSLPVARTEGVRIYLDDGRALIDGIASWWTACHGYNHPHIRAAVARQLETMPHVMFGGLTHEPARRLAARLAGLLPSDLNHVFFSDAGSVAVEVAMKMALQFWLNRGERGRTKFLAFNGGYHGDTLGTMAVCDPGEGMHSLFTGLLPPQPMLDLPRDGASLAAFEPFLDAHAGELAGIIVEPLVQGAGGMIFHEPEVLGRLRHAADRHGLILIFDEIFTGFGRTGTLWASEQFDLKPDIMTMGKGMGGGFPLSAVASSFKRMSAKPFGEPSGSSSSYGGNPLAAAAGLGAVEIILEEKLVENSARVGALMLDGLKELQEKYRFIGDVRGRGLMIGVEMVADRTTKEPLDKTITRALFHEALERGLITMSYSQVIRINPPLVISEDEAMCGIDILDESFAAIARRFGLD